SSGSPNASLAASSPWPVGTTASRAPPLPACGERSIGGLRPPFLTLKNADAKRRLCEARRVRGSRSESYSLRDVPLPACGERERALRASLTTCWSWRPALGFATIAVPGHPGFGPEDLAHPGVVVAIVI